MKRAIAVFLATALVWCGSATAMAEAPSGVVVRHSINGVEDYVWDGVTFFFADLRFQFFDTLSASISQSEGKTTCTGTVSVDPAYSTTLVVTLQRSKDGSRWSDVSEWKTGATTGKKRIVLEKSYYLTKGYSYRIVSTVTVVAGSQIETADCVSNVIYY